MLKYQMEFRSGTAHANNVGFTVTGIRSVTQVYKTRSVLPLCVHLLLFRRKWVQDNHHRWCTLSATSQKQTCLMVKKGLSMDEQVPILSDKSVDETTEKRWAAQWNHEVDYSHWKWSWLFYVCKIVIEFILKSNTHNLFSTSVVVPILLNQIHDNGKSTTNDDIMVQRSHSIQSASV